MAELYTVQISVRRHRVDRNGRRPGFDFEVEGAADSFAHALRKHFDAAALPMALHFDETETKGDADV